MSFNRESITWQAKDGTWSIGFFRATVIGDDPEWDVDYDYRTFSWVSTGHPTEEAARDSWNGPNPGCFETVYELTDKAYDRLDAMVKACKER